MYEDFNEEIETRLDEVLNKMDLIFKAVIYQGLLIAVFVSFKLFS